MALSVQPNVLDNKTLSNYQVVAKPGGYDYFFNGAPITREQYTAGSGLAAKDDPAVLDATAQNPPPSNPNGGSGTAVVDKSGDIALQNAGIASVDEQTNSGIAAVDKKLLDIQGRYNEDSAANEANYTTQSDTNQNNLQKNKQSALVNASQGRRGLFGTLSSLGALNGSGIDLANHAVQAGANEDLSGAADNYSANQTGLDTGIETFRKDIKRKGEDAVASADNMKMGIHNNAAKSKQSFYSNLANDYAAMNDGGNASKYTGMAAGLYPEIAKTSLQDTNLAYTPAAYTPGSLASYLAGSNSTQVSATPTTGGQGLPGLVASPTKRKLV